MGWASFFVFGHSGKDGDLVGERQRRQRQRSRLHDERRLAQCPATQRPLQRRRKEKVTLSMPLPTLPSSQMDSPLGGASMFSDSPAPAEGALNPTGQQAAQEKQTSFIAQHKQLTEQLQAMAQGFPEFAP